jgi:hypothetical protein
VGQVEGQTGVSTLARTPPLTTLAHVAVGETREVGGRGEMCDGWRSACPAGSPATPVEGEAGRAWRLDRHPAELLHPPAPVGGGRQVAGRVRLQEERSSLPDEG